MNFIGVAIDNREKGQVPISIGTSLALEAGFGIYPDRHESPPPFTRVKQVWINLRTLVRNLIACLPTNLKETLLPDDVWRFVHEEMTIIKTSLAKQAPGVKLVFYVSEYNRLDQRFPGAVIKLPSTPKQSIQQQVEEASLKLALEKNHEHDVEFFDFELHGQHPSSFLLTHLPVDLLSRYFFERLELLESHTGKIKGPGAWNSKLTNGKELSNIPFNRFTLQLFGDNGNMFSPHPVSLRRALMQVAIDNGWSNVTSIEKIRDSLKKIPNDMQRTELLKML